MPRAYPYLVSSLPTLHFDQPDELDIGTYLGHIEGNLQPRDRACARFLREWIDLVNLEAALAGRTGFLPHGRFSPSGLLPQSEDAELLPPLWQDYVGGFQADAPPAIEPLWLDYFDRGTRSESALVCTWSENERTLRTAIAVVRAEKQGRPLGYLEAVEQPDILEMIGNARLPDMGMTHRFPWMATLGETLARESPLETERALDLLRWRIVDEATGTAPFGADVALGYFLKLLILSRWTRIDHLAGYDRLSKDVLGGKFIA